ncbi:hypothetical protein NXS99_09135, partial [Corynebacterium sp. HS2168-gen11]|nr:hypothetical protein [Corynebacterium sp. HS2168-gen11]
NSARAVTQIANNAVTYALQSDGDDASRTQKSTDKDGAVAGSPDGVNVDAGRSVQEMFTSTDLTGATFKLTDPVSGAKVDSYTVDGKGTYTIAPDGVITFVADKNYAGVAPEAVAVVTTAAGETATAKYQPVVVPVVKDLSGFGTVDRAAVTVPLDAANKEIDPATVKFADADQPAGATVSEDGRTLTVPNEGTWTVDPATGAMTFTPLDSFAGDPTPVKYVGAAKDALADGTKVSTIKPGTVTVTYPAALPKVEEFAVPGEPITGVEVPGLSDKVDPNSVRLGDNPDAPLTPLVVPGEGTWTLEVVDGKPVLKFEPAPGFKGVPSPVPLVAKDKNGQPATAGSVTIFPVLTSVDDKGKTQTSTDDGAGDKTLPIEDQFPAVKGKTFTAAFEDGQTTKTTPEGVFTVDPATGVVTFEPAADFVGTAQPVTVVATADDGTKAKAKYTPTVVPPLAPGEEFGVPGAPVDVALPALPEAVDPDSVGFINPDDPNGDPVKELKVPGEGTWTIENNVAKFVPEPTFKKVPTPVVVGGKTKDGNKVTPSTVSVFPLLTSVDDKGKTQTSTDDGAGDKTLPIEDQFPAVKGKTFTAAFEDGQTTKTTPEGVFTVDPATGVVTFEPAADFVGTAQPVTVVATADDGTKAKAKYTPVVIEPAVPAKTYGPKDTVQKSSDKDAAADGLPADEGKTVDEMFPGLVDKQKTIALGSVEKDGVTIAPENGVLTVPGVGAYKVEDNVVVFDPEAEFAGVAPAVPVVATTEDGYTQTATYTAVVAAAIPSQEKTGEPGEPVTTDDPFKDIPGVVPESIGFVDPKDPTGDPKKELKVPGEGVWTIDPDGKVTFTPEDGFTKTPTPVNVGGKGE